MESCANPTNGIKPYVESFKKNTPGNFNVYKSDNKTMSFAFAGSAENAPIVFVHGSPGSWDGWAQFLESEELKKNFQILVPDRLGYGGSNYGVPEKSLAKQAQSMMDVLQFNKSGRKAILVGHSYGGPVVVKMAIDHPDKIAGIILVAASVDPKLEITRWFQYPASWWPIRYLIPKFLMVCNEEILPLQDELEKMAPEWSKLQVPVISIHGTKDDLVPIGNQDFEEKNVPPQFWSKKYRLEGMNHFIPWRQPEVIFQGIKDLSEKKE